MNDLIKVPVLVAFVGLMVGLVARVEGRSQLKSRCWDDWLLDGAGLTIQGILIPLLQASVVYQVYQVLLPELHGRLPLSPLLCFLLSFVGVDYLYYWNHRGLHQRWLWRIHQTHHTATQMDVLVTSRNTLWASFFILYLWVHPLFLYLVNHPTAYLLGVSVTAALDLWRHSGFNPPAWLISWLSPWLVLPNTHAWHHASHCPNCNYGANFTLWDKLHGTYDGTGRAPAAIGLVSPFTFLQKWLFPFP